MAFESWHTLHVRTTGRILGTVAKRRQARRERVKRRKTPLRAWHKESPHTWQWLSGMTGLPLRTVMRVAAGYPCSGETALAIHEVTQVPQRALLRGVTT